MSEKAQATIAKLREISKQQGPRASTAKAKETEEAAKRRLDILESVHRTAETLAFADTVIETAKKQGAQ
jgi:hypothetical protein